jgi:quinol monooxygenase YgiN
MIHVVASIRVKPGMVPRFLDVFKANIPDVRNETGCIDYFPAVDIDVGLAPQVLDQNAVTVIERWESVEALRAHSISPHMQAYREKVKDMVEGISIKVIQEA